MSDDLTADLAPDPVSFALQDRLRAQEFDAVFKNGMALVERTASYLDGAGRAEARYLRPAITVLYATESMRLTARLLDIASWLLIRRALRDGEITEAEARLKRQRLKLHALGRPSHTKGFDELPDKLQQLVYESYAMMTDIMALDGIPASSPPVAAPAAVPTQGADVISLAARRRSRRGETA